MTDLATFERLRAAVVARIDEEETRTTPDQDKLDRLQELLWEVRWAILAETAYQAEVVA